MHIYMRVKPWQNVRKAAHGATPSHALLHDTARSSRRKLQECLSRGMPETSMERNLRTSSVPVLFPYEAISKLLGSA